MMRGWWNAACLDKVLWRVEGLAASSLKSGRRAAAESACRFEEWFPFAGEYSEAVRKRAIWREAERRRLRVYKNRRRGL
jgi:hypothetical protein